MRRLFTFVLFSLLSHHATAGDIPGPSVGERFGEDLAMQDQTGTTQSYSTLSGDKGLVVVFVRSADWCPFCQKQLVDLNDRVDEFRALGLNVVSISVDDVAEIAAFTEARSIRYPMLADPQGDVNKRLGIRDEQYPVGTYAFGVPRPTVYILDRDGIVRARYMEPTYKTRPDLDLVISDAKALTQ